MAKIYKLMIDNEQIGDVYYDEDDAIDNAKLVHSVLGMTVTIWEAEEIEDVPFDLLNWSLIGKPLPDRKGPYIQTNSINGDE